MSNHHHVAFFEEQALCASSDPDMWFPERRHATDSNHYRTEESMQARAICGACPANPECLEYALRYSGLHGIWAGLDPTERSRLQDRKSVIPFHTTIPMSSQGWVEGVKLQEG
jgi:WhiB family transcriptional regulator, redox-sensing transcriptional regulator